MGRFVCTIRGQLMLPVFIFSRMIQVACLSASTWVLEIGSWKTSAQVVQSLCINSAAVKRGWSCRHIAESKYASDSQAPLCSNTYRPGTLPPSQRRPAQHCANEFPAWNTRFPFICLAVSVENHRSKGRFC